MSHMKRWGAVWILTALFLASWAGQAVSMLLESGPFLWPEFWSATLENWQSEFLQLAVQCLIVQSLWANRHLFAAEGSASKDDVN